MKGHTFLGLRSLIWAEEAKFRMGGDWLACLGMCVALEAALEALEASAALFFVRGKVCGKVWWSECTFSRARALFLIM